MIRALVSGVLYDAPKVHAGKSGKPFITAKVRAEAATIFSEDLEAFRFTRAVRRLG